MQREKDKVQIQLDKLLSSEASRLNYPLKVNTLVKKDSIVNCISSKIKEEPSSIFIINIEPDGSIFQSKDEIISTLENTGAMGLLTPPGQPLRMINRVLLPVDFNLQNFGGYSKIHSFIRYFHPVIDTVSFEKNGNSTANKKNKNWLEIVKNIFIPSTVKNEQLSGDNFQSSFKNYIQKNHTDLLILFQQKQGKIKSLFKESNARMLLPQLDLPTLVYFQN